MTLIDRQASLFPKTEAETLANQRSVWLTKTNNNPSHNTETRATVTVAPPSGTYMTTGVFTYPVYDSQGNLTYQGVNARSSSISYMRTKS